MALYTIADPHLSFGTDKPMDIFAGWSDYTERFETNWRNLIGEDDTVVIPGDISWAMKLEDALRDLKFIDSLPGKKIIGKGNHDYWWCTMNKMNNLLKANNLDSISFLFNNAYLVDGIAVCGSRGWFFDDTSDNAEKVISRECGRLRTSIEQALTLSGEPIVFLHYPVVYDDRVSEPFIDVLKSYNIKRVYFGHVHGSKNPMLKHFEAEGIKFSLISADYLGFIPKRVFMTE